MFQYESNELLKAIAFLSALKSRWMQNMFQELVSDILQKQSMHLGFSPHDLCISHVREDLSVVYWFDFQEQSRLCGFCVTMSN